MFDRERIYLNLPISLQKLACNLEGWKIDRTRYGRKFDLLLAEAEGRAMWDSKQISAFRDERIREFIQLHVCNSPFYTECFRQLGIRPSSIHCLEDLACLPIITKSDVQDHISAFVPLSKRSRRKGVIIHTSGTTGRGLRFSSTPESLSEQWAIWWRYRRWHGIKRGTWCGYFGGRSVVAQSQKKPPFWRYNIPGRQVIFSGYHMSHDHIESYVSELRHSRPPWLHGYPSALSLLASYIVENKIDLGYEIRWLTVGAESLLPQQAEVLRRAFGLRPRQHYGMAEAVANFSECELGHLHVDEDFAAVEFIPIPNSSQFRIVGTNFTNSFTPLVRYDVGDTVSLIKDSCPCGRPGRIVERVDGRIEDYVVLANGAKVGRLDHAFKDLVNIQEAQVVQNLVGAITVRVVRGKLFGENDESALMVELRKRLGKDTSIAVEYVEQLQRTERGKLRFVVSTVREGHLIPTKNSNSGNEESN